MAGSEPTLSEVHADLVARMEQDKRLRVVEQQLSALQNIPGELVRMEGRIMLGIGEVKSDVNKLDSEISTPRPVWPAVSAIVAAIVLILIIAERLYAA